jgi:hypothetical protein
MRLMQSGLRALQRTQAMRQKAEAEMHPEAMERAGWWFRDASVAAPEPAAARAAAPDPVAYAEPATSGLTDAEHYALVYPEPAALIRAGRGVPDRLTFCPPEPEILKALVNGTSPILRAINNHPYRPSAAAA